mgnify:CR=1 FL=1
MKTILITGAAGFIGFHLSEKLSNYKNINLILCDNFLNSKNDNYLKDLKRKKNIKFIKIDLNSIKDVMNLPNADVVIHFAAINGTQNFYYNPLFVMYSSTVPTLNLLKRFSNIRQFIYAGSSEAYAGLIGKVEVKFPTDEKVPMGISENDNARWSYAISKIHGEVAVANTCKQYSSNYTILRFHNIYGPRMGTKHVIPDFLNRVKKEKFELYGGRDTRSFLYINDAVEAIIKTISKKNCFNKTINIGSNIEIEIHDLGKKILDILNIKKKIKIYPSPKGSVKRRLPNTNLLKKLTRWKEKTTLDEGLKKTINFYLYE